MVSCLSILVIIFSVIWGTSKQKSHLSACLTAQEKTDLEHFFRSLLFDRYGAFVLFGSKPLCDMLLTDTDSTVAEEMFQQWIDSLPEDKRKEFKDWRGNRQQVELEPEYNLYRGWLAWEKVRKTFEMKRFILRIAPLRGPDSYELVFVNIQQAALTLAENYTIFKNAAEMDFHPLQVVFELQNPDPVFWRRVLSLPNHLTKGLLFGFGLRNSIYGDWSFSCPKSQAATDWEKLAVDWGKLGMEYLDRVYPMRSDGFVPLFGAATQERAVPALENRVVEYLKNTTTSASTSTVKFGEGSPSNFTIPLFGAIEGDDTVQKYTKEKAEIEKRYRGKDLVEVTLQRLAS